MKIVYQKQGDWIVGHIQEYPDYETQGRTIEELKANLIDIYQDISSGLVPDATPFDIYDESRYFAFGKQGSPNPQKKWPSTV